MHVFMKTAFPIFYQVAFRLVVWLASDYAFSLLKKSQNLMITFSRNFSNSYGKDQNLLDRFSNFLGFRNEYL